MPSTISRPGRRRGAGHTGTCANCGAEARVPFKPTGERPIYCKNCFTTRAEHPAKQEPRAASVAPAPAPSAPARPRAFGGLFVSAATATALSAMGITDPTPIQTQAIPVLLEGKDVIGLARTGSGKTLAFGIPMAERVRPNGREVAALVLVPTRELAIQVGGVLDALTAGSGLRVGLLYGGRSLVNDRKAIARGLDVVVGTPGRTLDHLRSGTLRLSGVRVLVLDEADEMLDRGFARDVEAILAHTPHERQTALFSATMPPWVQAMAERHQRKPVRVEADASGERPPEIEQLVYDVEKADKPAALRTLLDERGDGPVIVFGKTKHGVKKLAKQLATDGYPVDALQGNLSQNARERVMAGFRSGQVPILVATNVAARGLDVEGVERVINYDLPDSPELFTHRVGRTGRMGRRGEAITFLTPEDMPKWREIERTLKLRLPRRPWAERTAERRARRSG
jgi:ATP-dependent RNA helicase DeaD